MISSQCKLHNKYLYKDKKFKIIKTKRDYVLIRVDLGYEKHAHFRKLNGAKLVISLYNKKLVPFKEYFIESMRRVTTEQEFNSFGKQKLKPKYKNRR